MVFVVVVVCGGAASKVVRIVLSNARLLLSIAIRIPAVGWGGFEVILSYAGGGAGSGDVGVLIGAFLVSFEDPFDSDVVSLYVSLFY